MSGELARRAARRHVPSVDAPPCGRIVHVVGRAQSPVRCMLNALHPGQCDPAGSHAFALWSERHAVREAHDSRSQRLDLVSLTNLVHRMQASYAGKERWMEERGRHDDSLRMQGAVEALERVLRELGK